MPGRRRRTAPGHRARRARRLLVGPLAASGLAGCSNTLPVPPGDDPWVRGSFDSNRYPRVALVEVTVRFAIADLADDSDPGAAR